MFFRPVIIFRIPYVHHAIVVAGFFYLPISITMVAKAKIRWNEIFDDFTQFLHLIELWLLIIVVIIDDNNADVGWYCGKSNNEEMDFII